MKNRFWTVLLVISIGVNLGFLLHWFRPRIVPGPALQDDPSRSGWHVSSMRHGLGLSAEQAGMMENERRRVMAQARPLQDELRLKRRELFLLVKKGTLSDAELDGALGEISRLQAAVEKIFILHVSKLKGFFTAPQLHKYEGFFQQGLCPGMMSEQACPSGVMAGNDCVHDEKKANSIR